MATITKYANKHTAITTGYTNPTNAYATGDTAYATAAPGQNAEISAYWGFPAFSTGDIPDNSVINSVTVVHVFKVSTAASIATEYIRTYVNTTGSGGAEVNNAAEPTSDTSLSHSSTAVTLTNLRTADVVRARTRSARGNSGTSVTFSIEYVRITVDYTAPVDWTKDLTDSVSSSETISNAPGKVLTDAVTSSETIINSPGKVLTDSITTIDTATASKVLLQTLTDSVTISDSLESLKGLWTAKPVKVFLDGLWQAKPLRINEN